MTPISPKRIRWLLFPGAAALLSFLGSFALAAPNGAVGDTNIKYVGRWDFSNSSEPASYWGGAYVKVMFAGTTVQLQVGHATNYFAKIDNGPWVSYLNASGTINLTPTPLANATHQLSIAQGKDYDYVFDFEGLLLDPGATTSPPVVESGLIEFIGDSITAGYTDAQADVSDYAWVCSEGLNMEHTQIAYPGIKLTSGYPGVGMDAQYFKQRSLAYANSPNWDFSTYTANIVVINLGQNDGTTVPDAVFQSDYVTFLANVRGELPNAEIYVMRTFLGTKATPTLAAVNARIAAGDNKLRYVDTTGWLTQGTPDYNSDNLHPSVSGHLKAGHLLEAVISGGVPIPFETENLAVHSQTAGIGHRIILDPGFSEGAGTILDSTGIGQQVTYVVPNVSPGSYNVIVGVKAYPTRGIWQLSACPAGNPGDSSNIGAPQDAFSSTPRFTEINLGAWHVGITSDKWFTFTITGKSASSTGYTESFDYITLAPQ